MSVRSQHAALPPSVPWVKHGVKKSDTVTQITIYPSERRCLTSTCYITAIAAGTRHCRCRTRAHAQPSRPRNLTPTCCSHLLTPLPASQPASQPAAQPQQCCWQHARAAAAAGAAAPSLPSPRPPVRPRPATPCSALVQRWATRTSGEGQQHGAHHLRFSLIHPPVCHRAATTASAGTGTTWRRGR
jgi:hypothetical protein